MMKSQLVSRIGRLTGIASADIRLVLDALATAVAEGMKECGEKDKVVVPGVCTLKCRYVKATKAHPGRNPLTGEDIMVKAKAAHWKAKALPAKVLRDIAAKKRK